MAVIIHAYIEVSDLEKGVAFYTHGLGLKLRRQLGPEWAELEGANTPVFLLSNRPPVMEVGDKRFSRSFDRHWTPVHLDFISTVLEPAVKRAEENGAVLEREIQVRSWGRMANMADPFGNGFDLIELAPGGYDVIERQM